MPKWIFWTICGVIILFGLGISAFFAYEGRPDKCYYAAPVLGALLVAVGWMVTSVNTTKNSERDHTLKLIASRSADKEIDRRKTHIHRYFPGATDTLPLPGELAEYPKEHEVYSMVFKEINASEYIAWGYLRGVYDKEMLRNEVEIWFLKLHVLSQTYIPFIRQSFGDDEIWASFCKVCLKWSPKPPRARRVLKSYSLFANAACACGQKPAVL
jgi:hypothetical protein